MRWHGNHIPHRVYAVHLFRHRERSNTTLQRLQPSSCSAHDAEEVNRIYAVRNMVPVPPHFFWSKRKSRAVNWFVAEAEATGAIVGTVMGIDHCAAFGDRDCGSSLWCLAVDPQAAFPGIGEALVRHIAAFFQAKRAHYLDLSVIHDNEQAIALYEKVGFFRIPMFSIKRKNVFNEALFTESHFDDAGLNPYARIIINEALRRGIGVNIVDAEGGFFRLTYGGRSIVCRESLSELTTAVAMSMCDDKRVTRRIVKAANVNVPAQIEYSDEKTAREFLNTYEALVVKPARGEQGKGVSVGLKTWSDTEKAIAAARTICDEVVVEEFVEGIDLRLIVINYRVVAGAVRVPASVIGNARDSISQLIEHQSRRRAAATGGEFENSARCRD